MIDATLYDIGTITLIDLGLEGGPSAGVLYSPMLNVKIRVDYEGDWTSKLSRFDVSGQFLASTYRDRRYLGLLALDAVESDFEGIIDTIRTHSTTESVDVIESFEDQPGNRLSSTLLIRSTYLEYTPMQILLYEGYLPFGAFGELQHGAISFDLLVEDREEISDAVDLLRGFGSVEVERISREFRRQIFPSVTEWTNLLESIPSRQQELLQVGLELGYYDLPREVTLQELADEIGIAKTTASQHLRKAESNIIEFFVKYMKIHSGERG